MKFLDYELIKTRTRDREQTWYFKLPDAIDKGTIKFNCVKIQVYYEEGGMNYFSGNAKPRGYYVIISPIELGEYSEHSVLFSSPGGYVIIEETNRFNRRKFETMPDKAQAMVDLYAERFIAKLKEGQQ